MKAFLLISTILLASQFLFAQQKTEVYFGVQNRNEWARDIIELYDKGYFISGGFEGDDFIKGWNIKTDINLGFIYDKVMEHDLCTVSPRASISDENGNIYVTGYTNYPAQWPFVTKLDSCGSKIWCKILSYEDEFNYGWSSDIILTGNDEVVILATLIDDEQPADQINMTHLIGLSDDGEVLWKKPYASRNDYSWIRQPIGNTILQVNNDFYISGSCYWPYPDDTTHWFLRPLFIGIDSFFEEKWILPFAPLDSVFGDAFKTVPLNDSILMGVGMRRLDDPEESGLLMFYNTDGTELGYYEITKEQIGPDVSQIYFTDVERTNDSLFILASPIGINNEYAPHCELIVDTMANIYNSAIHNSVLGQQKFTKTFNNNFVVIGEVEETKGDKDIYVYKIDENLDDVPFDPTPHTYDSLCPGGIQSGTIDLTSCFVWTDVSEAPLPGEYYSFIQTIPVKVYPNPVTEGSVTFEFENTEHHRNMELKCFNLYGEMVHNAKVYRYQEKTEVNISGWRKGMYFGVVYSGGKPVGKCKFVIQ